MNCVKGDLARWLSRNALVEVLHATCDGDIFTSISGESFDFENISGKPTWTVRMLGRPQPSTHNPGHVFAELPVLDAALRPIRDPGEDATDEVVERLGKPVAKAEGVPA